MTDDAALPNRSAADPARPSQADADPTVDAICRLASATLGVRYSFVVEDCGGCRRLLGFSGVVDDDPRSPAALLDLYERGVADQADKLEPSSASVSHEPAGPCFPFYARSTIPLSASDAHLSFNIADTSVKPELDTTSRSRVDDLAMLVASVLRAKAMTAQRDRLEEEVGEFGRWNISLDDRTIYWSSGLAKLYGREQFAQQIIDLEDHIACYHPSEQPFVRTVINQGWAILPKGVTAFTRRHRVVRPDGEVRDVLLHGRTERDECGRVIGARGITFNISHLTNVERGLQASEALFRNTLENMTQGLVQFDADGRVSVFNQRARAFLELPEDALYEGAAFQDLHDIIVRRGDFDCLTPAIRASLDRQRSAGIPHSFELSRGNRTVEYSYTPLAEGGAICTYTDVSASRAAAVTIRKSEHRFRLIADNVNDVIILGDMKMRCLYVSPAIEAMLGYRPHDFIGRRPIDIVHPEDEHHIAKTNSKLLAEGEAAVVSTTRYRHKDGQYIWIETSVRLVRDSEDGRPTGYAATLRDVSARVAADDQIRHMALHDGLTGLPNRTLFHDRLERAIIQTRHSGRPFAVLACDLDRFKSINDSLGHPAGDALLRVTGERMRSALRPYDTVARLGGDEFAIVLADLDNAASASRLAEDLITTVSRPIDLDGRTVEVGMSIGLTVVDATGVCADEMFKHADIALYEAKAAGRGTHRVFSPDAGARAALRGQLGIEMKEAIRSGEFRLAYQPIVSAATGGVTSFEALMRWDHPQRGSVSPAEFIPVAEDNGLIVPLGIWAINEACRQAAAWPDAITVGVNVSAVQLHNDGLERAVRNALAASNLRADRLKLEVTESVLMSRANEVIERLYRLKELGVKIALDDFGTGYSSLSYLRRFPFDILKIDQLFVKDIADPDTAAIVKAVADIGSRLGMSIIAEGVETEAQLNLVRQAGCTEAQGFLLGKPQSKEETLTYLRLNNVLNAASHA